MSFPQAIIVCWCLFLLSPSVVHAQWFATCQEGAISELDQSIAAHSEQTFRLNEKFLNGYYRQGPLPSDFPHASREDIQAFLHKLAPRKAGVLFHAQRNGKLCTWLLLSRNHVVSQVTSIQEDTIGTLQDELLNVWGVTALERQRMPIRKRGVKAVYPASSTEVRPQEILAKLSHLLLPASIADAVLTEKIDTVVVVPIAPMGTLPWSALNVGTTPFVEVLSVVIAPGFSVFRDQPYVSRHSFVSPMVAGDPPGSGDPDWDFPALPGARAEAQEVARMVGATPFIGSAASKKNVAAALKAQPAVDLIYLATHGVADRTNPRDASFLLMSDGRWPAKEIQNIPLRASHPLVIMSACQTGLGKDFDVGTIGMARAWYRAGASQVVMSLWNVDDQATRNLMTQFIQQMTEHPADKALQRAMQKMRESHADPSAWAGFTIFGLPEL